MSRELNTAQERNLKPTILLCTEAAVSFCHGRVRLRAFKLVLLPPIKLSVLLRDLTPDVCGCSDISGIRAKKKEREKQVKELDQLFSEVE